MRQPCLPKVSSLSIENQSLALHEYAASMPEALNAEITEFIDNGYSGTNFERPQVQKLIELVRANQIDCIIVKDFSRFGRNSIETGYFIERVFPLFHMGEIDLNTYKAEKAACDELLLKTKNAYAAVLAQAKQKQDEQARQDSRMEASKAIFDADTLTTELAELLIDRVLVYPDKRIEIAYKIQDIFD